MKPAVEKRQIDGLDVTCVQFSASTAYDLVWRLGKVFGAPLLVFIVEAKGSLANLGLPELIAAVREFFDRVNPGEILPLSIELLGNTTVTADGKQVALSGRESIDLVFTGRLPALFKVLQFALEVNYAGFFDDDSAPQ